MYQSIPTEKIIAIINQHGPVQPLDVRRALGEGDTMLIGAILSQLHASGKIAISRTRRGGGPFYYLPDKPELLERLAEHLGEKDRRTFELLKESKVLRADEQEPLVRVSLQNIPDFAKPFSLDDTVYWRYYLVDEDEAGRLAKPATQAALAPSAEESLAKPQAPPQEAPTSPEVQSRLEDEPEWAQEDALYQRVLRFARTNKATIVKQEQVKAGQELALTLAFSAPIGQLVVTARAYSRKTLPEQYVWKALLDARSAGLPLLVLKDSPFPKSLEKKFSDVPNVYFTKI